MRAFIASLAPRTSTSTSDAGRDFEKEIVVKVNVPEVLRAELARPSWKREHVALGTNTDPYQWVEGRYKLMRGIWEAMRDFANPCSILTKSPLLLRDKDLLLQVEERASVSACLSVPTLDEKAWRATEPHTPHPARAAGGGGGAQPDRHPDRDPDRPADARHQRRAGAGGADRGLAEEAGATTSAARPCSCAARCAACSSTGCGRKRPDLLARYEQLYRQGAYLQPGARKGLRRPARPARKGRDTPPLRPPAARARAAEARARAADQPVLSRAPPRVAAPEGGRRTAGAGIPPGGKCGLGHRWPAR